MHELFCGELPIRQNEHICGILPGIFFVCQVFYSIVNLNRKALRNKLSAFLFKLIEDSSLHTTPLRRTDNKYDVKSYFAIATYAITRKLFTFILSHV